MMAIAKGMENEEGSLYKYSPYQTLIATQMCTDKNKNCGKKIPAGNGKTFWIIKLVKGWSQKFIKSLIVVTNEMIYQ